MMRPLSPCRSFWFLYIKRQGVCTTDEGRQTSQHSLPPNRRHDTTHTRVLQLSLLAVPRFPPIVSTLFRFTIRSSATRNIIHLQGKKNNTHIVILRYLLQSNERERACIDCVFDSTYSTFLEKKNILS